MLKNWNKLNINILKIINIYTKMVHFLFIQPMLKNWNKLNINIFKIINIYIYKDGSLPIQPMLRRRS